METLKFRITGVQKLMLNNPQSVDPFNHYARSKKVLTGKRVRTDEDLYELQRLDIESKLYMKDDGTVYVPSTWIIAALGGVSFKRAKIAKKDIRSCVFTTENQIPLKYDGMEKVKAKADISGNKDFFITMLVKQGQVKIAKSTPIFSNWSFETEIEFDSSIIDRSTLVNLLEFASNYGGWGDFRPSFGRARFEEIT